MIKPFWFDAETTGLDPVRNDIWSLSFEIEDNLGECIPFDLKMCPDNLNDISPEALAIGKITLEEIRSFQPQKKAFFEFKQILGKFVNPFVRGVKLTPAGYNIAGFDIPFLREWFKKNDDKYYNSWFSPYPIDVYLLAIAAHALVDDPLPKYKLVDVCAHHGIVLDQAHDSRFDVKATRELCYLLRDLYFRTTRPIIF